MLNIYNLALIGIGIDGQIVLKTTRKHYICYKTRFKMHYTSLDYMAWSTALLRLDNNWNNGFFLSVWLCAHLYESTPL